MSSPNLFSLNFLILNLLPMIDTISYSIVGDCSIVVGKHDRVESCAFSFLFFSSLLSYFCSKTFVVAHVEVRNYVEDEQGRVMR